MKTLGQIAFEASIGPRAIDEDHWEVVAKAVAAAIRAAIIEECAKVCDDIMDPELRDCAAAIRSLALEAK